MEMGRGAAAGLLGQSREWGEGGAGLRLLGREKESGPREGGKGSGPSAEREGFSFFISIFFYSF